MAVPNKRCCWLLVPASQFVYVFRATNECSITSVDPLTHLVLSVVWHDGNEKNQQHETEFHTDFVTQRWFRTAVKLRDDCCEFYLDWVNICNYNAPLFLPRCYNRVKLAENRNGARRCAAYKCAHCMPAEVLHCLFSTLTWRNIAGTVLALQRVLVHFN